MWGVCVGGGGVTRWPTYTITCTIKMSKPCAKAIMRKHLKCTLKYLSILVSIDTDVDNTVLQSKMPSDWKVTFLLLWWWHLFTVKPNWTDTMHVNFTGFLWNTKSIVNPSSGYYQTRVVVQCSRSNYYNYKSYGIVGWKVFFRFQFSIEK